MYNAAEIERVGDANQAPMFVFSHCNASQRICTSHTVVLNVLNNRHVFPCQTNKDPGQL